MPEMKKPTKYLSDISKRSYNRQKHEAERLALREYLAKVTPLYKAMDDELNELKRVAMEIQMRYEVQLVQYRKVYYVETLRKISPERVQGGQHA